MHFSLLWATVLLLASFGPAVQALDTDSAKLLKECYNEGYKDELTTFQSILKEVPTR